MSRILCIEDEPALRQVIVEELILAGYETVEAKDGMEGLSAILESKPDLVLCDITMPKMSGHELLQNLRDGYPEHADLPFVFLSALADKTDVIRGQTLGADDYLTKPVDLDILLSTVEARINQVNRMEKLKQADLESLKKQIIETLPHEFRTPLNAILGYAEMMKEEVLGPIGNSAYVEYVENIYQGGKRLQDTVEKLLAISEIACDRVQVENTPFDLIELIDGVISDMQAKNGDKAPDIKFDNAVPYLNLPVGHTLVTQAIREILDNACKFTPAEGHVDIVLEKTDKFAVIMIIDSGIGISSDVMQNLSSAFSQGESGNTRSFEGLGLGLTLAEKSINLIGGTIQFESTHNKGTRVTICAPLGDGADALALLS